MTQPRRRSFHQERSGAGQRQAWRGHGTCQGPILRAIRQKRRHVRYPFREFDDGPSDRRVCRKGMSAEMSEGRMSLRAPVPSDVVQMQPVTGVTTWVLVRAQTGDALRTRVPGLDNEQLAKMTERCRHASRAGLGRGACELKQLLARRTGNFRQKHQLIVVLRRGIRYSWGGIP